MIIFVTLTNSKPLWATDAFSPRKFCSKRPYWLPCEEFVRDRRGGGVVLLEEVATAAVRSGHGQTQVSAIGGREKHVDLRGLSP